MDNCSKCGKPFQRTAYQVRKCEWSCPSCNRAARKVWRSARKAAGKPVRPTKMPREWHRTYEAEYLADPVVRARRAAQMRKYAKAPATRPHHVARWHVRRAIEAGRLTKQPCEVCGTAKAHAHHDDYSKPLDVRWLCQTHHSEHHARVTA